MFFEDEKDIIREDAEIHIDEDGIVTWEDVLNTDEDIPMQSNAAKTQQNQKTVDMGDELELVENEEDVDDKELMSILNNVKTQDVKNDVTKHADSNEDFDIDSQLANVVLEQQTNEENPTPRKQEQKPKQSTNPLLIVVLLVLLVAAGVYYAYTMGYIGSDPYESVTQDSITPKTSVQEEMNNTTSEDIAQRQTEQENIPVVSEDEANDVKAEEKKEEEKKQIVKVIPTGRPNPFMPIAKYAKTDIPDAQILYDKSGIPKPPEEYGIQEQETVQLMTIAVSGIMYDSVKPSAIITYDNNDYFVQKGDRLDNYRIVEIAKNYVTIAYGNNTYRANIGEEFKISSRFEGSAQFMSKNQGGGRQYYSIHTDEKAQSSDEKKLRYVSEDEITIKAK